MSRKKRNNLTVIILILLIALSLSACSTARQVAAAPAVTPGQKLPPEVTATPVPETPEPTETLTPVEASVDFTLEPPAEEIIEPPFSPDLSEQEPVEDTFFDDTAFVGNSLVRGLELYGGMKGGDFRAVTSTTVVNIDMNKSVDLKNGMKGTLLQKLFEKQYGKIYVLLGINEISFEPDYFAELYGEMLDKIRENEPDADIYIMGLSPVTRTKAQEKVFTPERLAAYNEALYALALEKECYYVDLMDALADEEGYLPEEKSVDGVHLTRSKYMEWADYLRTHYVPESE